MNESNLIDSYAFLDLKLSGIEIVSYDYARNGYIKSVVVYIGGKLKTLRGKRAVLRVITLTK